MKKKSKKTNATTTNVPTTWSNSRLFLIKSSENEASNDNGDGFKPFSKWSTLYKWLHSSFPKSKAQQTLTILWYQGPYFRIWRKDTNKFLDWLHSIERVLDYEGSGPKESYKRNMASLKSSLLKELYKRYIWFPNSSL